MTSPIAVLLIIGSAVVGPIEAQIKPSMSGGAAIAACLNAQPGASVGPYRTDDLAAAKRAEDSLRRQMGSRFEACADKLDARESLPWLCDRAMREIGADKDVRGHWYLWQTVGTAAPQPNDYNKPAEVRCIPVPAGYPKCGF